jgi:hypothetical protein
MCLRTCLPRLRLLSGPATAADQRSLCPSHSRYLGAHRRAVLPLSQSASTDTEKVATTLAGSSRSREGELSARSALAGFSEGDRASANPVELHGSRRPDY